MKRMKHSGVPWIGDIPVGWEPIALKYIATCNDDTLPEGTDDSFEFDYVDIGSVSYANGIQSLEHLTFGEAPSRARRMVKKGDVIVSTVRTYLRAISDVPAEYENAIVSTGFAVLRATDGKVLPLFLKFALLADSFVQDVEANSTGVSYPSINCSQLCNLKILLPSVAKQETIALYLEKQCTKIDADISKRQAVIEKLQAYKKSLIYEVVTGKREVPDDRQAATINLPCEDGDERI